MSLKTKVAAYIAELNRGSHTSHQTRYKLERAFGKEIVADEISSQLDEAMEREVADAERDEFDALSEEY